MFGICEAFCIRHMGILQRWWVLVAIWGHSYGDKNKGWNGKDERDAQMGHSMYYCAHVHSDWLVQVKLFQPLRVNHLLGICGHNYNITHRVLLQKQTLYACSFHSLNTFVVFLDYE